jgi:hypothetical protein
MAWKVVDAKEGVYVAFFRDPELVGTGCRNPP